ncbi:retinoic acid receptor beta [Plakobranchus ocellatus]|uniref:Retinoic acid receptor beta n=1 Tax=Plakobranchus ocellatus TaxID=259542 RepID=A0AAV3Z7Q1_9GAST|nr:retinoic acid receptor beta [Plakobranchus ocellatus]
MWLCHFIKFVKKIPGFSHLHLNDQTTLVKEKWQTIWLLSSYRGRFEAEAGTNPGNANSPRHYNEEKIVFGTRYADLSELVNLAITLCLPSLLRGFDSRAPSWYKRLQALEISLSEMILMMMICLSCPETCGHLERKSQVGRLHWLMRQALSKHMDKLRVGNTESFPKVLSAIQNINSDIGQSILAFSIDQVMDCEQTGVGLDIPLLTEVMSRSRGHGPAVSGHSS